MVTAGGVMNTRTIPDAKLEDCSVRSETQVMRIIRVAAQMSWIVFRFDVFLALRYVHNISGAWQYSGYFKDYMREGMSPTEAITCDKTYWGIVDGGHVQARLQTSSRAVGPR
jgi:hypothetical protein